MAHKIVWADQATQDLEEVVRFIAAHDPAAAERFGLLLVSKAEAVAEFPRRGRIVPEYADENVREIIVSPYRIICQVIESSRSIAIARIWHGARGKPDLG